MSEIDERYELNWVGKRAAIAEASVPTTNRLIPVPEESVDFESTGNLYIEGDNLDALKLMQEEYSGKVKMIYIDPPYNTGNKFIYNDKRTHSEWLSFMYPRLKLARNLLTEDGVIFISIDDHEVHNLRKLCDEIFGEGNFVANVVWKGKVGGADSKHIMKTCENILLYCKRKEVFVAGENIKENEIFPKYDSDKKRRYKTQLARKWGSNSLKEDRPNLFYPVLAPDGSDIFPILPDGRYGHWRWSRKKMEHEILSSNVEFIFSSGKWVVYEKIYEPEDGEFKTKKFTDLLDDAGSTANGTKELEQILGAKYFEFPKPTVLLKRLITISNAKDNDLILDFFSGSATTAHAVMQLNADDGGNRKFIMVQLPEDIEEKSEAYKAGYKNICEIGKERIRKAGKKIKEDSGLFSDIDTGFKVYRIV